MLLALAAVLACSQPASPAAPPSPDATPLFLLEARRESASTTLVGRTMGEDHEALRAITALGRVGDRVAIDRLLVLLGSASRPQREAAARALGHAALLGSDVQDAEARLITAWSRAATDERAVVTEVLGQLGGPAALATLADALLPAQGLPVQTAAALALARLGRRDIDFDDLVRARLTAATAPALRDAIVYALANEHAPATDRPDDPRLLAAAALPEPATRQLAILGLLRRQPLRDPARDCIVRALQPQLTTDVQTLPTTAAAAQALLHTWALQSLTATTTTTDPRARLDRSRRALAGLTCLADLPAAAVSRPGLERLQQTIRDNPTGPESDEAIARASRRTRIASECRLAQLLARDPAWRPPLTCPDPGQAATLEAAVLAEGYGGTWPERQVRLDILLRASDPHVRVAAVTAMTALWDQPAATSVVQASLLAALDDRVLGVVGAAADVITARFTREAAPPLHAEDPLWRALLRRADNALEHEPELYAALVGALAATRVPAGADVCQAALRHANPSVREAARACTKTLRGVDPGPQGPATPPAAPPVDPAALQHRRVRWTLTTEYGPLRVELDPTTAPWAVAMIVALSRRGFYDGLGFHRDVPGFVLQGGDPEGTGWGGPGFGLPSEPSSHPFARGAVGIADAGKDTGGSQFFFMHERAPHLDARYTWVGALHPDDLPRLDLLGIGDRIISSRVEVSAPVH